MNKILTWVLNFTKLKGANDYLTGKRAAAVSLAAALAASATIIVKLTEQGLPYLATVLSTPEFQTASMSWAAFFLALKGGRIEEKLKENSAK